MSELESRFVHRGYWVNEAKGPVMGQTLTTDSRTGTLIIALLAVLTSIGLNHIWHLLTYFYHQARTDGKASDGLFRQQQALLRTLPTPSTVVADSVKLWFAWRGISDRALARSLLLAVFALLFVAASLAGSIFSSYVASSFMIEVLVDSPFCGSHDGSDLGERSYHNSILSAAENFAPDCQGSGNLPSRCDSIFVRPNIPFSSEEVTCPFDQSMCVSRAIAFDSGLVDLNDAFGVNARDKDRVLFRKRSTCSVLSLEGRTEVVNASDIPFSTAFGRDPLPNEEVLLFYYGQFTDDPDAPTFLYSFITGNITHSITSLGAVSRAAKPVEEKLILIPELQRQDADVSLRLTATNNLLFDTPVNDPLFTAHRPVTIQDITRGENITFYNSDFPATMLGCAEQYQYCVKTEKGDSCTDLRGMVLHNAAEVFPEATQFQLALLELLTNMAANFELSRPERYDVQEKYKSGATIVGLPDDQWIQELRIWEATLWAQYQIVVSDHAIGPAVRDSQSEEHILPLANDGEKALCQAQKMRKQGGFVNINYFALVFLVTMSCVITLTDLVLFRSLSFFSSLTKRPTPRLDRWVQDGIFQLLRRAYEAHSEDIWKDVDKEVPVTVENTKLPDLPMDSAYTSCPVSSTAVDLREQAYKVHENEGLEPSKQRPGSISVNGTGEGALISPLLTGVSDTPEEQPTKHGENVNENLTGSDERRVNR